MHLTSTADTLVLRARRPDALDLARGARLVTIVIIAACGVYAAVDRTARDQPVWIMTMLCGFALFFPFAQFHLLIAGVERYSAFQRARRLVEIGHDGESLVVRVDGRTETRPDRLLIVETTVRRGPGRVSPAWGVCLAFTDRIVMLDEFEDVEAAFEVSKLLGERLGLAGQPRVADLAPLEFTSFGLLVGIVALPEFLLMPAVLVWVVNGAASRAIAGPFLFLLVDAITVAVMLRLSIWSVGRRVREVLEGG
jgi:hypothetical protein